MSQAALLTATLALVLCALQAPAYGQPEPRAPATEGAADAALREAVRGGDAVAAAAAVQRGGRPDQTGKLGVSLLQQAAQSGRADLVTLLLEAGATVDLRSSLGETPLHAAVRGGSLEVVSRLLAAGADPNARMKYGRTPLLVAAEGDRAEIARRLIGGGARVGDAAKYGVTALHAAAGQGAAETARVLLEAGADPLARDADGDTPYDLANRLGHAALVGLLALGTPAAERRAAADPEAAVAALEGVDFHNRTYQLDRGEAIEVRAGVAAAPDPGGVEVLSTTVLRGTLGEPAAARAAVLLRWTRGERGPFTTLLLYGLDAGGRAVELARLPTGEGALGGVRGFRFAEKLLVVTREQGLNACCAERLEETRYRWNGSELTAVSEPVVTPLD